MLAKLVKDDFAALQQREPLLPTLRRGVIGGIEYTTRKVKLIKEPVFRPQFGLVEVLPRLHSRVGGVIARPLPDEHEIDDYVSITQVGPFEFDDCCHKR